MLDGALHCRLHDFNIVHSCGQLCQEIYTLKRISEITDQSHRQWQAKQTLDSAMLHFIFVVDPWLVVTLYEHKPVGSSVSESAISYRTLHQRTGTQQATGKLRAMLNAADDRRISYWYESRSKTRWCSENDGRVCNVSSDIRGVPGYTMK